MELLKDVLLDSIKDTAQLIPFLFITYLVMEALEHSAANSMQHAISSSGAGGPVVGALLGAVPQCGFSAMAATLFSGRVITAGTLIAVILSTSDEMIPVLIANQAPVSQMLAIVAIKAAIGLVAGIVIDVALRALGQTGDGKLHIHEICEREHCHCDDDDEDDGHGHGDAHAGHHHGHGLSSIARSALHHTVQVTAFIFVLSFVLGFVIELIGEDALVSLLGAHPVRAIFLSALVGLIPNCAASVAIADLFMDGVLATSPMLSGLLASGGVGLLVLFRTNANVKQNLAIVAAVYVIAVVAGLVAATFGIII